MLAVGVLLINRENRDKEACQWDYTTGEVKSECRSLFRFAALGFFGAFFSTFCGTGPGAILVPFLMSFGIEPRVAYASGVQLTMCISFSGTVLLMAYELILLDYGLYVTIFTVLGTLPGIFF